MRKFGIAKNSVSSDNPNNPRIGLAKISEGIQKQAAHIIELIAKTLNIFLTLSYCSAPKLAPIAGCNP